MWPKVTILTPTLNAASVLGSELKSVADQDYPPENIEIIVADGGSTDKTVEIAEGYGAKVVPNPLRTGEAGKMAGLKHAIGEYTILIDSDNILPSKGWLKEMIKPLMDNPKAVGSEPWSYTWRKGDGFITRYCALIGMNDPLVHFLGNYDRMNLLTGKWTEIPHKEKDLGGYLLVTFDKRGVPTVGANGTVFRTSFLKENVKGDYLFDVDILSAYVSRNGSIDFIKVKNGIIHTYCESDIFKFAKKQRRRVRDYLFHKKDKKDRDYEWNLGGRGLLKFILSCVLVVPLFAQALKGYLKKKDVAWFFHPLACEITLFEYGFNVIASSFGRTEENRDAWRQ